MGYALSWVGVRGKSPEDVLGELGYRRTGEQEEVPESSVVCAQLRTGWFVVLFNYEPSAVFEEVGASELSRGAEVVACAVEEHVMESGCSRWADGTRVLGVQHDSDADPRHLDVDGTLPPELLEIVDELKRKQEEADAGGGGADYLFDVPVRIAHRLTGFRHDADVEGGRLKFDVLERVPPPANQPAAPGKTSWWRNLLGR